MQTLVPSLPSTSSDKLPLLISLFILIGLFRAAREMASLFITPLAYASLPTLFLTSSFAFPYTPFTHATRLNDDLCIHESYIYHRHRDFSPSLYSRCSPVSLSFPYFAKFMTQLFHSFLILILQGRGGHRI